MLAFFWLTGAIFLGWQINAYFLEDPHILLASKPGQNMILAGPWSQLFFRLAQACCSGLLLCSWLSYLLAAGIALLLPSLTQPLLPANLIILLLLAFWAVRQAWQKRQAPSWPRLARTIQQPPFFLLCAAFLLWLLLALFLFGTTFYRQSGQLAAGYSVFSDFAPHTALTSSFAKGYNWPTWYPHFANDGIAYHFLFFFLCGNLAYLGLPLDLAINLPSLIYFISCCLLLGFLAVRLTKKPATFILAPLLLFLRSSLAFFTNLAGLIKEQAGPAFSIRLLLQDLRNQAVFIGNTPNDDWGLWGVNVYANQRHFLAGLACLVFCLLLLLPELEKGSTRKDWFKKESWLIKARSDRKRFYLAGLIAICLPYWHGSALVALLLILIPVAFFAQHRLGFLLLALASISSAGLQVLLFQGTGERIGLSYQFGFIAEQKTIPGVLYYILMVTGLVLPLLAFAFRKLAKQGKILLLAFSLPLLFAFFISLTPDVTVNHKFIIIFLALANIYLADLLIRLWQSKKKLALQRCLVILLVFCLTITGLHELVILRNINKNTIRLDLASPLAEWVEKNTAPRAIFVSAPYHYHEFFLSGRYLWLGHSYYAWSAGHDTSGRLEELLFFLTGCQGDPEQIRQLIRQENLAYLIIDDNLRQHPDLPLDEEFFKANFTVVASFPGLGRMDIYDLLSYPETGA